VRNRASRYAHPISVHVKRPFVLFKVSGCTPADDALLAKNGSYPSLHASVGWAWALLLTELTPDRSDAILQRGCAFAQSRGICGMHWQSDLESARVSGATTVARLHANPAFAAEMKAAHVVIRIAGPSSCTTARKGEAAIPSDVGTPIEPSESISPASAARSYSSQSVCRLCAANNNSPAAIR
jgi:hypothetical protein